MSQYHPERQTSHLYYNNTENYNHAGSTNVRKSYHEANGQNSHLNPVEINNTQYVPRVVESGYIVGPPIAYSQSPYLPSNLPLFSPNKTNQPVLIETSNSYLRDFSPKNSNIFNQNHGSKIILNSPTSSVLSNSQIKGDRQYINQPFNQQSFHQQIQTNNIQHQQYRENTPSITILQPPIQNISQSSIVREETVSKYQYDKCLTQCKNWETKYNELYLKYMNVMSSGNGQSGDNLKEENYRLKQRIKEMQSRERNNEGKSRNVKELIERYKESTLKECYLLLDRYRLELKQRQ